MKDYTLLQPFHFQSEEEPKKEDFVIIYKGAEQPNTDCRILKTKGNLTFWYNCNHYNKALHEHRRKYVEPVYEWISFEDKNPPVGPTIYFENETNEVFEGVWDGKEIRGNFFGEWRIYDYESCPLKWCDKETHDKKLAYYNYHKVLFEGWEIQSKNVLTKGERVVVFNPNDIFITDHDKPFFSVNLPTCSIELFQLILKEHS